MGLKTFWTNLYQRLSDRLALRRSDRNQEDAVLQEIERIVRETDLTAIPVHRFRKKMIPTVRHAMQYIAELIPQVPGPVAFDPEYRDNDPLLRAMFLNTQELTEVLRSGKTLRDFFRRNDALQIFAMLIAERKQKLFLGTEKNGEIIRRDVPQKAIFFDNFKFIAPAVSLAETQGQVQHHALAALFGQAFDKITDLTSWKEELEHQREILKVKVRRSAVSDKQTDLKPADSTDNQFQEAMQILNDINKKLEEIDAGLDTPEDRLNYLCGILKSPESHLKLKTVALKLSRLGILLAPSSAEPSNTFEIAEFELGQDLKRAAVWVSAKRASVLTV